MRILLLVLCLVFLPGCVLFHGIGIRSSFHGYHRAHVSGYVGAYTHSVSPVRYMTMRMHMMDMQDSLYSIMYIEDYLRSRGVEVIATHMYGPYIELRVRGADLSPIYHFGIYRWCLLY